MSSKQAKKALFSSFWALLLCFAMLLGTTFAWFTDTASTSVNKIQAGNLDVALEVATRYEMRKENNVIIFTEPEDGWGWVSAENQTLDFIKAEGDDEILWEPGCTYALPPVRIVNNGNLSLKYKAVITGIKGDAKLNEVIEWTVPVYMNNTLDFILDPGAQAAFKISGHMKEEAGNEYQGLSIEGIAITVYATQATSESDSFDNTYDAGADYLIPWDGSTTEPTTDSEGVYHITSAAEFASFVSGDFAIPAGNTVVLDCDVDLGGATVKGYYNSVFDSNFDGQGHTVSNFTVTTTYADNEHYCGLFPYIYSGCSVKNLNVKDAFAVAPDGVGMVGVIAGAAYGATIENCNASNCTVVGEKKVGAVVGYISNTNVTNCSATDCAVYCKVSADTLSNGKIQADEVIGYNDNPATGYDVDCTDNFSNVTVTFSVTPTLVSTAADLSSAMHKGGTILLTKDITVDSWTPVRVDTASEYQPIANSISIDGNGHSISGLTSSLLGFNPAQYVEIKNLTIKNSNIVSNETGNNANCGAFAAYVDGGVFSFKMSNCHAVNVNVTANNSGAYGAGVLVGYEGITASDGVFSIVDCTVTGGSVTNTNGNAAGIVGMCYTKSNEATISGCTVSNVTITGEATDKQGAIVGTVCNGGGALEIKNCTYTGNAYGRTVGATVNVH